MGRVWEMSLWSYGDDKANGPNRFVVINCSLDRLALILLGKWIFPQKLTTSPEVRTIDRRDDGNDNHP